ncbi:ABC transporter ATP-binding protein [Patescibacteria group bacterium]
MPKVEIKNLTKIYQGLKGDKITALKQVNLIIKNKKYNTLLGPSGCGKTSLLKIICGLLKPTKGKILFDKKDVTGLSPQARDVGFVFQHFATFPHLDVWHNVSYGPVVHGWSQKKIKEAVERNLKLVGLLHRANAMPDELSGGMRQRLGLARALASQSKLLLLDEPLSALDMKIGTYLRYELKRIVKKYQLTAVHVTHNQAEAMTISDNIILMKNSQIVQTGTPADLYDNPKTLFAANFMGKCSFFKVIRISDYLVDYQGKKIKVAKKIKYKDVVLGVRPEKIHLSHKLDKKLIYGKIEIINYLGYLFEYRINVNGNIVKAYKRFKEKEIKRRYNVGDLVSFWFNPDDILVYKAPKDLVKELSVE